MPAKVATPVQGGQPQKVATLDEGGHLSADRRIPVRSPRWPARAPTALLAYCLLCWAILGGVADPTQYRINQLVAGHDWSVLSWEARHLPAGLRLVADQALHPPPSDLVDARVRGYLAGTPDPREIALDMALSQVIQRELIAAGVAQFGGLVVPPVALALVEPPRSLVVSPRHEIRVAQWALLESARTTEEVEALERRVESLGVSALVVDIGGIATYPTLVPADTPAAFALQTVAHEWVHTALFFRPLGRAYGTNPQAQAINETVADIVGGEVARGVMDRLGPVDASRVGGGDSTGFRQALRRIRLEVEELLARGDLAGAEALMERERQALAAQGYAIRRLNQAYFAFYGNYAEGPARSTEVPDLLRTLRTNSASLGEFLDRVSAVTDLEALRRLVSERGVGG